MSKSNGVSWVANTWKKINDAVVAEARVGWSECNEPQYLPTVGFTSFVTPMHTNSWLITKRSPENIRFNIRC